MSETRRINATREQRKKIMEVFGCSTQHLTNVLHFRRNSDRDERMRCFARKLGAKEELITVEELEKV